MSEKSTICASASPEAWSMTIAPTQYMAMVRKFIIAAESGCM